MKAYLAYISVNLKLTWRDKMVVFFNYLFPLIFFFIFAQLNRAEQGGAINAVFTSVLVIGVLGNGFFGGGIRAVVERESNILRRFKVAPITPAPILVSAIVVGLVNFFPAALLMFAISYFRYGMPVPEHWISALVLVIIGTVAFRAMGQIIASVANSMAESQIIIQSLYFPMLFLSGATFPISFLPTWVQIVTQFIPATHLYSAMQNVLVRNETLGQNLPAVGALILTTVLCTFVSMKLFRWEKEEKLKPAAKLWILAVLLPFFLIGGWQAYSRSNLEKDKAVSRELRRSRSLLIKDVRLFAGEGAVLGSASVLVRQGKIAEIYSGNAPEAKDLRAEPVEAQGKTLIPGLIDAEVMLSAPGGIYEKPENYQKKDAISRPLAAYLFSGVTTILSAGEALDRIALESRRISEGQRLGAEVLWTGPLFTTKGGPGTESFRFIPGPLREQIEKQFTKTPASSEEARRMVQETKTAGAVAIQASLDSGTAGKLVNRMDPAVLQAIGAEAAKLGLPLLVACGDAKDIEEAMAAGAKAILGTALRERIADTTWAAMAARKIAFMPVLAVREGQSGNPDLLERTLVHQVGPADLLNGTRKKMASFAGDPLRMEKALEGPLDNARRAYATGVTLIAGSGSGSFLVLHGPGVHREMQLLVKAGLPTHAAIQAATADAAKLLGIANRTGSIRKGLEATLLLVNGNPLQDIATTEAISLVICKGERVARSDLFDEDNQ